MGRNFAASSSKRLLVGMLPSPCEAMRFKQIGQKFFGNTPNKAATVFAGRNFAPDCLASNSDPSRRKQNAPILPLLRKKDAFRRAKGESRPREPAKQ